MPQSNCPEIHFYNKKFPCQNKVNDPKANPILQKYTLFYKNTPYGFHHSYTFKNLS
jgi:hypothetical protein